MLIDFWDIRRGEGGMGEHPDVNNRGKNIRNRALLVSRRGRDEMDDKPRRMIPG